MDPISAILLIGIMTVAGVKTGGAAVNDGIASARGHTPPSQERWRAREERRRQRGEQPRKDPGGIRRIWQNQMHYAAEKSAHKHQGRMDYLARNGDDIAAGKRERMERADRRRQLIGGKLAQAGGTSWSAVKTAGQKAAEAKRNHAERTNERAAWRENERRDTDGWVDEHGRGHPRQFRSEHSSGWELPVVYDSAGDPYCVHPDGSWSPYEPVPREAEDAVDDGTVVPFNRPVSSEQDEDTEQAAGTRSGGTGPSSQPAEPAGPRDPEKDFVVDPDRPGRAVTVAELHRRRSEQSRERQRRHEAAEAQAAREHTERMAGVHPEQEPEPDAENAPDTDTAPGDGHRGGGSSTGWATGPQSGTPDKQFPWWRDLEWHREHYQHRMQQWDACEDEPAATDTDPDGPDPSSTDTSTNTDGTDSNDQEGMTMTQHSGEITNLSDALDYVRSASEYCEQLYGQFETSLSQAHSAADDIGNEAGGMEAAISALTGFELTNEAGRLSSVQEHYNSIVQAMTDVETAISAAREALSAAQSDLDESAEEFQAQTGISEQASSHDEVANDMGFYVNA